VGAADHVQLWAARVLGLLAYADLFRLAFIYTVIVSLALGVTLIWALRRSFGSLWLAVLLTLLLMALGLDPSVVLVAVGSLSVLQSPPSKKWTLVLAVIAGAISALEFLTKFNTGSTLAAIVFVTVLALPANRRWAFGAVVAAFAAVSVSLWLLAQQHLDNLWAFVHTSLSVVSGYSQSLGLEQPGRGWEYYAAAALVIVGVVAALLAGRDGDHPRRGGLVIAWLVIAYLEFKEGFVRHDGHSVQFFATLLGAFSAFRWRPGYRAVGGLMAAAFAVAFFNSSGLSSQQVLHPLASPKLFFSQVSLVTDGRSLAADTAAARGALISTYGLDRQSYDLVRAGSVDIEPSEDSLAWAYQLRWSPTPEFQAFTAYTTLLDRANGRVLAQPSGPQRVLSQTPQALDGRYPTFDAPAAQRSLLCHFVAVHDTTAWEVLTRVPNRCGPEQPLATSERPMDSQCLCLHPQHVMTWSWFVSTGSSHLGSSRFEPSCTGRGSGTSDSTTGLTVSFRARRLTGYC
jgi:hypothetical protein